MLSSNNVNAKPTSKIVTQNIIEYIYKYTYFIRILLKNLCLFKQNNQQAQKHLDLLNQSHKF